MSLIENHKRRSKRAEVPFAWTLAEWQRCLDAWAHRCAYCGATPVEQDHVIPLSSPVCPGTVPWNMVPACIRCNRSNRKVKVIPANVAAYCAGLRPDS